MRTYAASELCALQNSFPDSHNAAFISVAGCPSLRRASHGWSVEQDTWQHSSLLSAECKARFAWTILKQEAQPSCYAGLRLLLYGASHYKRH